MKINGPGRKNGGGFYVLADPFRKKIRRKNSMSNLRGNCENQMPMGCCLDPKNGGTKSVPIPGRGGKIPRSGEKVRFGGGTRVLKRCYRAKHGARRKRLKAQNLLGGLGKTQKERKLGKEQKEPENALEREGRVILRGFAFILGMSPLELFGRGGSRKKEREMTQRRAARGGSGSLKRVLEW